MTLSLFCVIYMLGVGLVNAQSNPEEKCETALYFAWKTTEYWEHKIDPGITENYLRSQNIRMPVYGGALCLDKDNHATVEYVPGHFYVKKRMQKVLREVNEDKQIVVEEEAPTEPSVSIPLDPTKPLEDVITRFVYPIKNKITIKSDNPDFAYYLEKRLGGEDIDVIREEKNAIPDMNWRPEFKVTFQYPDIINDELHEDLMVNKGGRPQLVGEEK